MADAHPTELELLALVEDELPGERRTALRAHLETCPDCAGAVAGLEAGRAALQAAPAVEPPQELRRRISADLDLHEPPRRVYVSPMRLVTLLAPLTVVLALVAAVASIDFGGDDSGGGGGRESAQAEDSAGGGATQPEAASGGGKTLEEDQVTTEALDSGSDAAVVVQVEGPPRKVAALLREFGFDARVEGGRVVVRGAEPEDVALELRKRAPGDVPVVVERSP